jgi:hypothetical protein
VGAMTPEEVLKLVKREERKRDKWRRAKAPDVSVSETPSGNAILIAGGLPSLRCCTSPTY